MSRVLTKIDPTAGRSGASLTSTGRARLYREVADLAIGYVADTKTILCTRKSSDEI